MPENKEKKANMFWRIVRLFLFREPPISLLDLFYDGDVDKVEKISFKTARIFHIIALSFVPIVVTTIPMVLSLRENPDSEINVAYVLMAYICSFIVFFAGVFWHKVVSWRRVLPEYRIGVFMNHIVRLFLFWFIPLLASLAGLYNFATFYAVIPLIVIYTGILIYTFPTKKKWCKWSGYTSLLCD